MSLLKDITDWARTQLPPWQADAVRRLLLQGELTNEAKDELFLQLKSVHGLVSDPSVIKPSVLPPKTGVSGTSGPTEPIILKAIKCIADINAVENDERLPFAHSGLTVVYGENGAGKSSFARVLKRACNAKDSGNEILGNVFKLNSKAHPKAVFEIIVDGDAEVLWEEGEEEAGELARICVFDSLCGRVYLDDDTEYNYRPYGAEIFAPLAALIDEFRARLQDENATPVFPYIEGIVPKTDAYKVFSSLSHGTKEDELTPYRQFLDSDQKKIDKLEEWIAATKQRNIPRKIQEHKAAISKYQKILERIREFNRLGYKPFLDKVILCIDEYNSATEARRLAEKSESSQEFPLSGVRSSPWKLLYDAAQRYSEEKAYPGQEFPYTGDDAHCVLCMQELGEDAKQRMDNFKGFVLAQVEQTFNESKKKLLSLKQEIESAKIPEIESFKESVDELRETEKEAYSCLCSRIEDLGSIQKYYLDQIANAAEVVLSKPIKASLKPVFQLVKNHLSEVNTLEKQSDPQELEAKQNELDELKSRKVLHLNISEIDKFLADLKTEEKYRKAKAALTTRHITSYANAAISKELTPQL